MKALKNIVLFLFAIISVFSQTESKFKFTDIDSYPNKYESLNVRDLLDFIEQAREKRTDMTFARFGYYRNKEVEIICDSRCRAELQNVGSIESYLQNLANDIRQQLWQKLKINVTVRVTVYNQQTDVTQSITDSQFKNVLCIDNILQKPRQSNVVFLTKMRNFNYLTCSRDRAQPNTNITEKYNAVYINVNNFNQSNLQKWISFGVVYSIVPVLNVAPQECQNTIFRYDINSQNIENLSLDLCDRVAEHLDSAILLLGFEVEGENTPVNQRTYRFEDTPHFTDYNGDGLDDISFNGLIYSNDLRYSGAILQSLGTMKVWLYPTYYASLGAIHANSNKIADLALEDMRNSSRYSYVFYKDDYSFEIRRFGLKYFHLCGLTIDLDNDNISDSICIDNYNPFVYITQNNWTKAYTIQLPVNYPRDTYTMSTSVGLINGEIYLSIGIRTNNNELRSWIYKYDGQRAHLIKSLPVVLYFDTDMDGDYVSEITISDVDRSYELTSRMLTVMSTYSVNFTGNNAFPFPRANVEFMTLIKSIFIHRNEPYLTMYFDSCYDNSTQTSRRCIYKPNTRKILTFF
ncbi:MAG: hypothetical protein N2505_00065 [Endomicrobia bacterium]|nr:hypothetical protein [Endomicrobiia bacterium]